MPPTTEIPPDLQALIERVPDSETVRARIAQNRREAAFLRRLLKLAVDAEAVDPPQSQREASTR